MAGLYLVGAWLITQVAATLLPVFEAPSWVMKTLVGILAVGFIPSMIFAWIFELTPDGLKRDSEIPEAQSIAPQTAQKMNRLIVALLVLAVIYFGVDKFVLAPKREAAAVSAVSMQVKAQTLAAIRSKVSDKSIAVLPFVNMSTDPENEFFSDGLSEEILNSLARIDGMQVVGRTSSFQFKDKNEDLRSIGEKLGVATILEGSVRRDGNRARITAQLVRTRDGIHLWSETYDRNLQDTLAVQLDIAEKVAGSLNVLLDDKQRATMRKAGVANVDAFIAYQKGLKLYFDAHNKPEIGLLEGLHLANAEFDRATTLEPDFFEAHFAKADLYEHTLQADDRDQAERIAAQRAALETLQLAANNSKDEQQRLLTLAERQMLSDDWRGLSALIDSALKAPGCNNSNWMPVFAGAFGYGDAIEDFSKRAIACDPLNRINYSTRATVALANGQGQRALDIRANLPKSFNPTGSLSGVGAAQALMLLGRFDEAGKMLDDIPVDAQNENYTMARVLLGRARGESPDDIHSRLQSVDRKPSKYSQWLLADAVEAANSGNRAEANRLAAAMDARPAGPFLLAVLSQSCYCGAPFDLEYTPNFKARLAESGLRWPPPVVIAPPLTAILKTP
jgi:TolB-like protein